MKLVREIREELDKRYMREVYDIALRLSDDPDTKSACVIVDLDFVMPVYKALRNRMSHYPIIAYGANRIPARVLPSPEKVVRPHKYTYIEHCERDALFFALREGISMEGCTLYVNWKPCVDCARAIIASRIQRVVIHKEGQVAYQNAAIKSDRDWHGIDTVDFMRSAGLSVDFLSVTWNGNVAGRFRGEDVWF